MGQRRVALITGAGRGIGRGIALELAGEGFAVAGCDIVFDPAEDRSGLFEVKRAVGKLGADFLPVPGDVADLDSHAAVIDAVRAEFGRLDVLVNNAGIAPAIRADILETTPESFDRVMGVNLRGAFFLTQKAVPLLLAAAEDPGARPAVVFITSISAAVSSLNRPEYCVSKAGLSMAAKLFAHRLAGAGIAVFEVRPGLIRTDMTDPVRERYDKLIAEGLVPQGRWGLPEDVGRAVAGLVSGRFAYSTGTVMEVSGGMDLRRL